MLVAAGAKGALVRMAAAKQRVITRGIHTYMEWEARLRKQTPERLIRLHYPLVA